jgi:hypothetical protein
MRGSHFQEDLVPHQEPCSLDWESAVCAAVVDGRYKSMPGVCVCVCVCVYFSLSFFCRSCVFCLRLVLSLCWNMQSCRWRIYVCMYICMCVCACMYVYIYICIFMNVCKHVCNIYVYIYMYIYIYIYLHVCMSVYGE